MPIDLNNLQLEEFHASGTRLSTYYIGITKGGSLSIYSGFFEKESIKEQNFALIFYDKANNLIGLQFYKEKPEGKAVVKINKHEGKSAAWISAGNFFTYYNLNPADLKAKYKPETYNSPEKGTIYLINLNEKIK